METGIKKEKRRYPRIIRNLPLKIKHCDYDFVGQTQDISCIGAYCSINKYLPLFSIISIILLLPVREGENNKFCSIRCKGVVVRVEENNHKKSKYNIAIYFNNLKGTDKAKLSKYVRQNL